MPAQQVCGKNRNIFSKKGAGGGGLISNLKNFIANLVPAQPVCGKNRNEFFRKRGGGQRPFGNFPEINPFWNIQASLTPGSVLPLVMFVF